MAWLKDCLICNDGLCDTVNDLKEQGLSERAACKQMSDESDGLYSQSAIINRYRWHTGKDGRVYESRTPTITRRYLTDIEKEGIMSDEFQEAYQDFYKQTQLAMYGNWESTSKEAVVKCANNVIDLILTS